MPDKIPPLMVSHGRAAPRMAFQGGFLDPPGPGSAEVVAFDPQTGEAMVRDIGTLEIMPMSQWQSWNPMGSVSGMAGAAQIQRNQQGNLRPENPLTPSHWQDYAARGMPFAQGQPPMVPNSAPQPPRPAGLAQAAQMLQAQDAPQPAPAGAQLAALPFAVGGMGPPLAAGAAALGAGALGRMGWDALSSVANQPWPANAAKAPPSPPPSAAMPRTGGGGMPSAAPSPRPFDGNMAASWQSRQPKAPAYNYHVEMLKSADAGDAYARDFMVLRDQARQAAQEAASRGERVLFVPVHDYRSNTLHLVNANGADAVLDLNDEGDKKEYLRMMDKIGMSPVQLQEWTRRSSRPLMGYFRHPSTLGDVSPDFSVMGRQPAAPPPQRPSDGISSILAGSDPGVRSMSRAELLAEGREGGEPPELRPFNPAQAQDKGPWSGVLSQRIGAPQTDDAELESLGLRPYGELEPRDPERFRGILNRRL